MAAGLPKLIINFKELAETFVTRSERGIGFLIVTDTTASGELVNEINSTNYDTLKAQYTSANQVAIADALHYNPYKLFVMRIATSETVDNALARIPNTYSSGRITIFGGVASDYTKMITWVKAQNALGYHYHVLAYKPTTPDCAYVESLYNTKVTFADSRGEKTGDAYLPSLLGILCSCNVNRSATYYICDDLASVTEVSSVDDVIDAGNICLINDHYNGSAIVRVGTAVNTLTTFTTDNPEDKRYIDIVEAMDLISDDIVEQFKTEYVGKIKNTTDNQMLFLSYVNQYMAVLAGQDILDKEYANVAAVDVESQRNAWAAIKSDASSWDDTKVIKTPYKRNVYLKGDIKINGAMENLTFNIAMN